MKKHSLIIFLYHGRCFLTAAVDIASVFLRGTPCIYTTRTHRGLTKSPCSLVIILVFFSRFLALDSGSRLPRLQQRQQRTAAMAVRRHVDNKQSRIDGRALRYRPRLFKSVSISTDNIVSYTPAEIYLRG